MCFSAQLCSQKAGNRPGKALLISWRMLEIWPVVSTKHSRIVPLFANTTLCTYNTYIFMSATNLQPKVPDVSNHIVISVTLPCKSHEPALLTVWYGHHDDKTTHPL